MDANQNVSARNLNKFKIKELGDQRSLSIKTLNHPAASEPKLTHLNFQLTFIIYYSCLNLGVIF